MPPRTRRSAAVAAAALVADMQMESDPEEEEQVDVEAEDEEQEGDEAEEEDDEGGDDDGEGEESDEEPRPVQPRLKITLRLPPNNASSNGTATPDDPEMEYPAYKRTPKRRAKARVIQDADVESEDPMSPSESEESSMPSVRPMTTRQAVLASVVDSSHVSLNEGSRSKKQPLNETELALRREETARKRKNLSEKRLEDEKAETINRLLKKQSRPRNKRTNTADDRSPMPTASGSRTPKVKAKAQEDGEEGEAEEEDEEALDVEQQPEEVKPVMYRWVSSLREVPGTSEGTEKRMEVALAFSVPETFLPVPPEPVPPLDPHAERERAARGPGVCAIAGCGKPRKYRLPRDWTIGACDSIHLRVLANQA